MNQYFATTFGANEMCVIKHFRTGFEFYPQQFGGVIFYWRQIWSWWHSWGQTRFQIRTAYIQKDWNPNTAWIEKWRQVWVHAGFRTEQLPFEHTTTLNIQSSDSEMLRLYMDDILFERAADEFIENGDSTLEGVKIPMIDDVMLYDRRNRRLYGSIDSRFGNEQLFNHNRWQKFILLSVEHR